MRLAGLLIRFTCHSVYLSAETHPDSASLVDPLFAFGGKRVGVMQTTLFPACGREGDPAKRRSGESTARVYYRKCALTLGADTGHVPKACARISG